MNTRYSLTVLAVTSLLLIGCASTGEEENYKMLDENPDTLRDGPKDPSRFDPGAREVKTIRLVNVGDAPASPSTRSNRPTATQEEKQAAGEETDEAAAASKPNILERTDWPRITVGPVDGSVTHNPIYWQDCPIDDTYVDVLAPASVEGRLQAALSNPDAGGYSKANLLGLFVQPLKVGADIVLLPYHAVKDWPLKKVKSH